MLKMTAEQVAELEAAINYQEPIEPVRECSGDDIHEALGSGRLTEDQAWFLHVNKISWQINVRRG